MRCPLCDGMRSEPSWQGAILYEGGRYDYRKCLGCGSSYCDPMPSDEVLVRMYGPGYSEFRNPDAGLAGPKQPEKVLQWLAHHEAGAFVDFGCGSGKLLVGASRLGWEAVGVEFDGHVAESVAAETGCSVVRGLAGLEGSRRVPVDVIHLGDVIEHLTRPVDVLRALVPLLKPGGVLLAQGPLEAGPCLFATVLRLARWLRPRSVREMPPFHVLQATIRGQRLLFQRVGLGQLEFAVSEVSWPAPDRLGSRETLTPRALGLFSIRKVSKFVSSLTFGQFGNRYYYAGRRPEVWPAPSQ